MPEDRIYSVGKPYISGRVGWQEGSDFNYRSGAFELRVFYNSPTRREIRNYQEGKAEFGLYIEDNVIFLLFKFGSEEWSDSSYSIHLVSPEERHPLPDPLETPELRYGLHVLFIDAFTGIIKALRFMTWSHEFSSRMREEILEQEKHPISREAHLAKIEGIYTRLTVADMVRRSVVQCRGGD